MNMKLGDWGGRVWEELGNGKEYDKIYSMKLSKNTF